MRITQSELDVINAGKTDKTKPKKKNKFNAESRVVGGIKFHSGREASRYIELKFQQHCGIISGLKLQVPYQLLDDFTHKGKRIKGIRYLADFEYMKDGKLITEDSKGFRTRHYKDKRKMLLSRYPEINFIET